MASKSTRCNNNKTTKSIEEKLKAIHFLKHSRNSGFQQRTPKKINGKNLVIAFILMALKGTNTFGLWAEHLSILTGKNVSKQGIWKRSTSRLVKFLIMVLEESFCLQMNHLHNQVKEQRSRYKKYNRILVGDSTTLALPYWLSWCYPGNVSKGKKKAQLKIQVIYDLLNNCFVHFTITSFRENDQSRAKDILSIATEKDLIIRDLGYFSLNCFEEMIRSKRRFLSRLRSKVNIYNPETEQELNLLRELKKTKTLTPRYLLVKSKNLWSD